MQLTNLLPLVPFLALAVAAPAPASTPPVPAGKYYLKSVAIGGPSTNKGGLFIEAYHTGAGFNDAVLVTETGTNVAAPAFLNATYQEFNLGSEFPWGFTMGADSTYNGWLPVQINAGYGDSGFYFNNTDGSGVNGLKWNSAYEYGGGPDENQFNGWIACDWAHGLPQLFWLVKDYYNAPLPSSCANIELIKVTIS
ncbi:MAG: hypothetical protein MMC33_004236 [Icmadophila ericetorum]|nr:hypothetical protein [Icmadophila ericetorum]